MHIPGEHCTECEALGQFSNQFFSIILIQVALIVYCRSLLLISLLSNSFLTAPIHALILFDFCLLISGLGYPVLVAFNQQNIFSINNKQQEPYTSSKQQERHNKSGKTQKNLLGGVMGAREPRGRSGGNTGGRVVVLQTGWWVDWEKHAST